MEILGLRIKNQIANKILGKKNASLSLYTLVQAGEKVG